MDDLLALDIDQVVDIMSGGGLGYAEPYLACKETEYSKKAIELFIELGWKKNFVKKHFKNLIDSLMVLRIPEQFMVEYVTYMMENITIGDSIKENLIAIGLTSSVAKRMDTMFSPINNTCYTNSQLLILIVKYLFGKGNPITPSDTTHYYKPEIVDTWFTVKGFRPEFINISQRCSVKILPTIENILNTKFTDVNSTLYFHSTNWKSCNSILKTIDNSRGVHCLDFGQRPGFYMSPTIKDSLEWGEKIGKQHNENVIIVFSLPKRFPSRFKCKELVGREWVTVTKKSRMCKEEDYFIEEIHGHHLLYGNMVANPENVKEGAKPVPHNPPKKQLVSKRDDTSDFIHQRIVGCLYFQKFIN